jgi:MerR family transcriptional regulator, thiopeptide resistance regulator
MEPPKPKTYHAREFAQLAGVTVRALHHYDRIGLLKPRRTKAGYRAYAQQDLTRLEQIIALKFIGVPLKKIRFFAAATAGAFANALRAQRQTLEDKRHLLDQAIRAIGEVEAVLHAGNDADAGLYRRIIEVIEMQNNPDAWKQKYDDLLQTKIDRLRSLSPDALAALRAQWTALVGEIRSVLADDPSSPRAQELGKRWTDLLETLMGKPVGSVELGRHQSSQEWNPQMATFVDKPVWDFMTRVLASKP